MGTIHRILMITVTAGLPAAISTPAWAVDVAQAGKCSDILVSGTRQFYQLRENDYFQQIIYSRFRQATFQQAKNDKDLGFGIPVGEIVLGGNFTEEQFKAKKAELDKTSLSILTRERELDVALSSGDPIIVDAWSKCMKDENGGVSLRFEPQSATEIFAYVEWYPVSNLSETKITETVTVPPGFKVTTGSRCFKNKTWIELNVPCRATLIAKDAWQTWPVSLNTTRGSTQAYLPARIALLNESKPYNVPSLTEWAYREYKDAKLSVSLSDTEKREGWTFVGKTYTRTYFDIIYGRGYPNSCWDPYHTVDIHNLRIGYKIEGNRKGRGKNISIGCRLDSSISVQRNIWVPIGNRQPSGATLPAT